MTEKPSRNILTDTKQLRRELVGAARSKGWSHEEADDMAQQSLMAWLEAAAERAALGAADPEEVKQYARQAIVDRTRELLGRTGLKRDLAIPAQDIDQPGQAIMDDLMGIVPILRQLEASERAMLLLYTLHGFSQREIAALFGWGESRVSQILKAAREKLQGITRSETDYQRLEFKMFCENDLHPWVPNNIRQYKNGKRLCRICQRERSRRYEMKNKQKRRSRK